VSLPLVSVITPTWQRAELLLERCVPSVQAQTYPDIEHVIVSDGPDQELAQAITALGMTRPGQLAQRHVIRFAQLAEHDPDRHWGHLARQHGLRLARGKLVAYLDDDDAYRPHHVAALASALVLQPGASFAYSRMQRHTVPPEVIGSDPPALAKISTQLLMHRRELATDWGPDALYEEDWRLVSRWLHAGAAYAFVNDVTVDVWPERLRPRG
jgi:glycosyltransferase involved in cell wall biosynthesis